MILAIFLEQLEPTLLLDLTEIAVDDGPDDIQEQFGPDAARAWSYILTRGQKQVSGHFLVAYGVSLQPPTIWAIVQDMLIGDDIGDDLTSAQDTQRLHTLFDEEEIEDMRSMGWE